MSISTECLRLLRNCKKFVRECARRFVVHPSLDLALCVAVPVGHGLGEMRQLSGSNEGGSREGREKKNAREGTCLAPSRGMRERERENTSEPESENAVRGEGIESGKNTRSKLRLRKSEPTTESK